jgi:hypothetical protein
MGLDAKPSTSIIMVRITGDKCGCVNQFQVIQSWFASLKWSNELWKSRFMLMHAGTKAIKLIKG